MPSLLSDQQNNPSSALFKLLLDGSQPPIHTNPLQIQSCSEKKGPHPKFGRLYMVVVFVLLTLSFSLSLYMPINYQSMNIQADCIHRNEKNNIILQ